MKKQETEALPKRLERDCLRRLTKSRGQAEAFREYKGEYQSGQMGQTVNLLDNSFGGSNPSSPTTNFLLCGSSSVDRASAFQAEGREFEPRLPLNFCLPM